MVKSKKEHLERHKKLHECLDELVADFIEKTGITPSRATVMDLISWSNGQTKEPS